MLHTDLNGSMSFQSRQIGSGRISRPARFAGSAILFLSFAAFGATISRAQDQRDPSVDQAARRERARKQELQKRAKHIYTEEDLKHPNILTPEDRAQIEAKRNECAQNNNCSPTAQQNSPSSLDANSQAPQIPLGDVARKLRKEKELQALKPKQSEPFHLPFSTPALASRVLPERPGIRPPSQPVFRSKTSSPKVPSNVFRRDPFSAVPVRPEVPRPENHPSEIRPSVRESVRTTAPPKAGSDVQVKVQRDVFPDVRPDVYLDFSKAVRPTLYTHRRLTVPALPKISSHSVTPRLPIPPSQPSAPGKSVQPAATFSAVHPAQPPVQPSAQPKHDVFPGAIATQRTIQVLRGDSLWKLAQHNLGRGNRYPELLAANPGIANPNQIRAGAQLILPPISGSGASSRITETGNTTIKVRRGDTLWALAQSHLGRASAWPRLATANPSLSDPNRIFEGQTLFLPASSVSVPSDSPTNSRP